MAGFYKDVEEFSMRGVNSKEMIAFIGYGRERGVFSKRSLQING